MTDLFLTAQSSNHLSTIYIVPSNPALGWEYILYTHNFYPLPNQNNTMGGGAAVGGGFDALLTQNQDRGFRGLFKNGRALGLACFASLGGVLYGYNQVC